MSEKQEIEVFTGPGCGNCVLTKALLDARKIRYVTRDVSTDELAMARVTELGYRSLPVVVVSPDNHWCGHRISNIVNIRQD